MSIFQMQAKYGDNINLSCAIDEDDITLETLFAYFVKMTDMVGYSEKSWCNLLKSLTDEEKGYVFSNMLFEWAEDTIFDYEYYKENPRQN